MRPKLTASYRVEISPEARREIRSLPGYVRAQVIHLLGELAETPRPSRSKELSGKPAIYRIWVAGRWRIAYHLDDGLKRIRVLRVRLKDEIDYDSLDAPR